MLVVGKATFVNEFECAGITFIREVDGSKRERREP